jgi:hypothetical protein
MGDRGAASVLCTRQTLGNGAYAQHYYNARGLLTELLNRTSGGAPLAEYVGPSGYNSDMTYDAAGNRLAMQVPQYSPYQGTVEYTYDSQDRLQLEDSTRNGGYEHDPAYDAAFNPTTFRGTSGLTYNDDNQRNATGYAFDGNGNPTSYGGATLAFDAENRMTQYGTALYCGYTGDGLRAWKDNDTSADVRTYFLYDGGVLLAEMDASGSIAAVNTWGGQRPALPPRERHNNLLCLRPARERRGQTQLLAVRGLIRPLRRLRLAAGRWNLGPLWLLRPVGLLQGQRNRQGPMHVPVLRCQRRTVAEQRSDWVRRRGELVRLRG